MLSRINTMKICLFFLLSLSLCSCSAPTKEPLSKTDMFFDTVITIQLYDTSDTALLEQCFQLCKTYENKFSRTIETSEISRINHANGSPVTVSDETIELLQQGLRYCELSNGAFDITIAPVSTLWDFKSKKDIVPTPDAVASAISHVDYHNILIDGQTVTLTDPQAAIDLGGIAKGYIADKLKEYLVKNGVKHGLINLGGNVLTIGTKLDGSDFTIGIQKPFDEQNKPITSVNVNDKSVVSSGVYERYFKIDNKLYHHILDTGTGYPIENHLLGVTIISDASVDGDGLSTTCFALGLEKGMEYINSQKDLQAIFITDDFKLHYSNNLNVAK
ncbi:MAG: FAD:protein FMN transferase [Lachnospiraceae bacterium]